MQTVWLPLSLPQRPVAATVDTWAHTFPGRRDIEHMRPRSQPAPAPCTRGCRPAGCRCRAQPCWWRWSPRRGARSAPQSPTRAPHSLASHSAARTGCLRTQRGSCEHARACCAGEAALAVCVKYSLTIEPFRRRLPRLCPVGPSRNQHRTSCQSTPYPEPHMYIGHTHPLRLPENL